MAVALEGPRVLCPGQLLCLSGRARDCHLTGEMGELRLGGGLTEGNTGPG